MKLENLFKDKYIVELDQDQVDDAKHVLTKLIEDMKEDLKVVRKKTQDKNNTPRQQMMLDVDVTRKQRYIRVIDKLRRELEE